MVVTVLCRHWGIHLHWYISALWLLDGCAFLNTGIDPLFQTRYEWFHLSTWHLLSSSVSATEHISIISATCILCYIKCFHHRYHLVLSSSPWYILFLVSVSGISCFALLLILLLLLIIFIICHCYPFLIMLQHNIVTWATNRYADLCHVGMIVTHLAGIAKRLGNISIKWHWCQPLFCLL